MATNNTESAIRSSEVAFPRGGATSLTPLEVKEISNEVTSDVLFETATGSGTKRSNDGSDRSSKKSKKTKLKKKASANEEDEEKKSVSIENFSFSNITPETLVLAKILQVGKRDITLGMGDNLVGYAPITSISDEVIQAIEAYEQQDDQSEEEENEDEDAATYRTKERLELPSLDELFTQGQWLRAKVVKPSTTTNVKAKKRIQFTIQPDIINKPLEEEDLIPGNMLQCSVKSIEDRGIIMNTGIDNLSGFLSNKDLTKDELNLLKVGSVILTSISAKPKARTVNLKPIHKKSPTVSTISSIESIEPGILVDALVADITKNGVIAKVFGLVDGTFNLPNLNIYDVDELKHKYSIGNTVKARVIAVLSKAGTKKLILSHLPQIVALKDEVKNSALEAFPLGHILDDVKILARDPNYAYVSFGSSEWLGEVHNSNLQDDVAYSVGSQHKGRVIGYNAIENLLIFSLKTADINTKYLNAASVPIGEYLSDCVISKVLPESEGIEVKIFGSIDAFVPKDQMSDIRLVYPERKFKVGSKVKARVLKRSGKKLLVTLRKSLVNVEDDEVLTDVENAEVGKKTPGTVVKFVPNGAIIAFFGSASAFLPKNEISETFVNQASDYLKLGQTVNVKIIKIDESTQRLVATLRQSTEFTSAQSTTISELVPGKSIIKASVVEKAKDTVIVEVKGSDLRGVIYSGHLSDGNYEQNRALFKRLPIGEEIEALVLEKDLKARTIILSCKKSLIDFAKNSKDGLPAHFKDIKEDSDLVLHGFVKSVTSLGLFVSFAGRLTGLVLAKYAVDNNNEQLEKKFYKYQSVLCYAIRVDNEKRRFLLSLKKKESKESQAGGSDLINAVDPSMTQVSDYKPGVSTKCIIKSVKGTQLNVQLADNVQGRIDISQCFNDWDDIKDKSQPLSQFHRGETLDVSVVGYHDAKTHSYLPVTHKNNKNTIVELSLIGNEITTLTKLQTGAKCIAFVNNVANGFAWVSISPSVKGRISFMELGDDCTIMDNLAVGNAIQAKVRDIDNEHGIAVLTGRSKVIKSIKDVSIGSKYPGRILKVKETFVLVELGPKVVASAYITDALDDYTDKLESVFQPNNFVSATILDVDEQNDKIAVSLRSGDAESKCISSIEDLSVGDVVRGFVKNIANNGVYVSLGRTIHALVRVSDLSDSYLKDWKKFFQPHQVVLGKISACGEEGRVLMTLKESEVNGELNILKKFDDLQVGDFYEGSVRRATDFGVFVKLDGTLNISGLCHHSEIADKDVENVTALFSEGDRVKVKILKIDSEKKQLSLGMKASYFKDGEESEDVDMDEDIEEEAGVNEDEEMLDGGDEEDSEEVESAEEDDDADIVFDVENVSGSDEEADEDDEEIQTKSSGLSTNGFDWTASILDQAENDSESDEDDFTQERKKKKSKTSVVEDITGDLNTRAPQSVSDFERLLVGNPNSSILWMNYMSFQLQLSEIDKAREIGERALKIINYRDETEKLNIWIALLNLENTFGDDESLENTFKRSCQYMDSFTMHQKLSSIFIMSEKFDKADELFKTMTKKFGKNVSTWISYGSYLLDRRLSTEAHEVLAKALQVLPKKEHIEVVRKFAQLEFSKGEAEQGRSLFEGLLSDAPKRIDLWNVYIDQEIKQNDKAKVRSLFERVILKKLSKKQAKFFFSKWLEYEEETGSEQDCARIKAKASEYVQNLEKDK